MQLGATLGGILGRGIGNVANDRGFFEVTNPVLQKLTQIQGIYSSSMQDSDPNDPLSFYNNLQKRFADAGLGQQSLMASVEAKKFEGVNLKSKSDLLDYYSKDPGELSNAIQRATASGNEAEAKKLTTLSTNIETKRSLDIAKEVAQTNLINAQTEAQKAIANKQFADIESGKFDWKVINDITGAPISMAKIDKRTGATTYEPIGSPSSGLPPITPPKAGEKGAKPNPADFNPNANPSAVVTPTPVPIAAAPTAAPAQASPFNQATGVYNTQLDPVMQGIYKSAADNRAQLESDPAFQAIISKAIQDRKAQIQAQFGSMVKIQ